jgi:hypothetical protein
MIVILILLVFVASVFFVKNYDKDVQRPSKIPADAVWVGGPDGGSYYRCSENNNSRVYCDVYNDQNGEVEKSGYVKFTDSANINDYDLNKIYNLISNFDGEYINMKNGDRAQLTDN